MLVPFYVADLMLLLCHFVVSFLLVFFFLVGERVVLRAFGTLPLLAS